VTAGELRGLLAGVPDSARVRVRISKHWWRWATVVTRSREFIEIQ
jgi:hypothetical protein